MSRLDSKNQNKNRNNSLQKADDSFTAEGGQALALPFQGRERLTSNGILGPSYDSFYNNQLIDYSGSLLRRESVKELETSASSNLAARGLAQFAGRAITFGALGGEKFTEGNLSSVEKSAYSVIGQRGFHSISFSIN